MPSVCQICLEESSTIAGNPSIAGALCRRKCQARVCVKCLEEHVRVSFLRCFEGTLPAVLCPVCIRPMRMSRWLHPITPTCRHPKNPAPIRREYYRLCARSSSLTAPCCGWAEYTHLPSIWQYPVPPRRLLRLRPSKVAEFRKAVARFCGHNMSAQAVISFSLDTFGADDTRELVERALPNIADDERRARLMLELLHKFPNTYTRCCNAAFCFKCKRAGHHDECEDMSLSVVDPNKFVPRCRNCHIPFVKDEGCDTVQCICGHEMSYTTEVALQEEERARGREVKANSRLAKKVVVQSKINRRRWTAYWNKKYK